MYLLRLDDASDFMDVKKWGKIEKLLAQTGIKPLVGIIPKNEDSSLCEKYSQDKNFWMKAQAWQANGWTLALHGYEHRHLTNNGGINPIHLRSEFAGISYEEQCEKIKRGYTILKAHGIDPTVFFAPFHTFDQNTLQALKSETTIRIISDTIANDIYSKDSFFFLPQQCGKARKLPLNFVTFCYHPNCMSDKEFHDLEAFLKKYKNQFQDLKTMTWRERTLSPYDFILRKLYFIKRKQPET